MGIPNWLLKIIASFLSGRQMIVRFKGKSSKTQSMPGGGPQGSILGCFIFIILINFLGYRESLTIGKQVTQSLNKRAPIDTKPLTYHSRTNHTLPDTHNQMQVELNKIVKYAEEHDMLINYDKTKGILFNCKKSYDFEPELYLSPTNQIEIVEKVKLLGLTITSDLSWKTNTTKMCQKGFARMWMLRRLENLGASRTELVDTYKQQILSVLEYAAPVWAPGITKALARQIERVQRTAVYIILGNEFTTYKRGLTELGLQTLAKRRTALCTKFTIKAANNDKFSTWFEKNSHTNTSTRSKKSVYKNVQTRTKRYQNSPIPVMTDILNSITKPTTV